MEILENVANQKIPVELEKGTVMMTTSAKQDSSAEKITANNLVNSSVIQMIVVLRRRKHGAFKSQDVREEMLTKEDVALRRIHVMRAKETVMRTFSASQE